MNKSHNEYVVMATNLYFVQTPLIVAVWDGRPWRLHASLSPNTHIKWKNKTQ
jgi:hypothetical protein